MKHFLYVRFNVTNDVAFCAKFGLVRKVTKEQECIPVGCVPSVAVTSGAVSARGGGCLPGGVSARGVAAREGVYPSMH